MRYCINSLGSGDTENCFTTCKFLQNVYAKFLTIGSVPNHGRDFMQKMSTMRASTLKTEHVCFNLIVRGSECKAGGKFLPPPSLDMFTGEGAGGEDVDEGFY
jgi:predicted translin family RNA/ssDNA-binding protein